MSLRTRVYVSPPTLLEDVREASPDGAEVDALFSASLDAGQADAVAIAVVDPAGTAPELLRDLRDNDRAWLQVVYLVGADEQGSWLGQLENGRTAIVDRRSGADALAVHLRAAAARGATEARFNSAFRVIAHDLRSPMIAMRMSVDMLDGDPELPEDARTDVEAIAEALEQMDWMTDGLSHLARQGQGRVSSSQGVPVHVGALVEQLIRRPGLRDVFQIDGEAPGMVFANPDGLRGAIRDLVHHAARFRARGSEVQIRWDRTGPIGVLSLEGTLANSFPDDAFSLLQQRFGGVFLRKRAAQVGAMGLGYAARYAREAGGALHVERGPGGAFKLALGLPASSGAVSA